MLEYKLSLFEVLRSLWVERRGPVLDLEGTAVSNSSSLNHHVNLGADIPFQSDKVIKIQLNESERRNICLRHQSTRPLANIS